ncbi:MAG TPA: hypothetical protein VN643_03110 [Pyrinomonadaceae bacterium]|nr:hypothetical protein [Pyrinomonadaceae bacterium]
MGETIPVKILAEELKLDTNRLIDEIRREGVDVSVPSSSVSKELAEKIRAKYFPRKGVLKKRTINVRETVTTEDVAGYEATIDQFIAEMERIQREMTEDRREIMALQVETRTMLAQLIKAA